MESVKVKLEPGVKVKMEYGSDDQYLSSLQWTDEEMSALIEAVISDGRFLIPAGNLQFAYFRVFLGVGVYIKPERKKILRRGKSSDMYFEFF